MMYLCGQKADGQRLVASNVNCGQDELAGFGYGFVIRPW